MSLNPPRDPLLTIARFGTTALMALFAFVAAAVLVAAVSLVAVPSVLRDSLATGALHVQLDSAAPGLTAQMLTPGFLAMVAGLLVIVAVMLVAAFLFVRLLRRIIDSVGAGDPFVPSNADRLARMAWLLLGIELATVPLHALAEAIGRQAREGDIAIGMDVSLSNLFVALVLFILARVFREGTRLRDEVEGTV